MSKDHQLTEEHADQWSRYDESQDWREDGPFDIAEVDLHDDEVDRIDLGALIITPDEGLSLKLVTAPDTTTAMFLVVEKDSDVAMQVSAYAAPSSPGFCSELREVFLEESPPKDTELAKGPFGTEIRRVMTVVDDRGRANLVPVRDWLIAGPRWVLNVRFLGQAAIDLSGMGVSAPLVEFMRNIIVRRGEEAMMPGAVLGLTPGDSLN